MKCPKCGSMLLLIENSPSEDNVPDLAKKIIDSDTSFPSTSENINGSPKEKFILFQIWEYLSLFFLGLSLLLWIVYFQIFSEANISELPLTAPLLMFCVAFSAFGLLIAAGSSNPNRTIPRILTSFGIVLSTCESVHLLLIVVLPFILNSI